MGKRFPSPRDEDELFVPITEGGRTGVSQIKNQQNLDPAGEQSNKDVGHCSTGAKTGGSQYVPKDALMRVGY